MRLTASGSAGLLIAFMLSAAPARATSEIDWFNQGVRFDVQGDADQAFVAYLKAAELGGPSAQFNVAAMLDSGRGHAVRHGRQQPRGTRVPRPTVIVAPPTASGSSTKAASVSRQIWIWPAPGSGASGLGGLHGVGYLPTLPLAPSGIFSPPDPVFPKSGASINSALNGVELVWTNGEQPEPVRYFVEIRALTGSRSEEVFLELRGYVERLHQITVRSKLLPGA